jgi:hypothetical protein
MVAPDSATTEILRLSALRSPLMGWMEQRQAEPGRSKRAAGTKKTALFDIVNRNYAATRPVPAERAKSRVSSRRPSRVPAKRAPRRRFCARRAREPGPRGHTTRYSAGFYAGSRVSFARPGHQDIARGGNTYAFARACAACTSSQMRVGVSGSSRGCTPSVPSALAMALAMTPPAAMMPPSPAPLAPSGLIGEG